MFAVLVESGDVLELAFVLLFFQCGNHNWIRIKWISNQIIGFWLLLTMIIISFLHKAVTVSTQLHQRGEKEK